jgi:hypothetical protein
VGAWVNLLRLPSLCFAVPATLIIGGLTPWQGSLAANPAIGVASDALRLPFKPACRRQAEKPCIRRNYEDLIPRAHSQE